MISHFAFIFLKNFLHTFLKHFTYYLINWFLFSFDFLWEKLSKWKGSSMNINKVLSFMNFQVFYIWFCFSPFEKFVKMKGVLLCSTSISRFFPLIFTLIMQSVFWQYFKGSLFLGTHPIFTRKKEMFEIERRFYYWSTCHYHRQQL